MRVLPTLGLLVAGMAFTGCHHIIHHRMHHRLHGSHHHSRTVVRSEPRRVVVRPKPVVVVRPAEPSAPRESTAPKKKVLLPHEWLAKRHRAHMDALKGD